MKTFQAILAALLLFNIISANLAAQGQESDPSYNFKIIKELPHTMAKNQGIAGTCWSYAATSFLESEIMRKGIDSVDLSELYFVYHTYTAKAKSYIMRHGLANFSQGGQAHDVINVIRQHGMLPESAYTGKSYEGEVHNHMEIVAMLNGMLKALNKQKTVMPIWIDAVTAVMDVYFGTAPTSFEWQGVTLNPKEFQKKIQINPDDYIELTSYNYYPFYKAVILDIPDNWSNNKYYNVKLDELVEIIDNAIDNGYTVCWDGDISEKGFNHDLGFAVLPDEESMKNETYKYEISPEQEVNSKLREAPFLSKKSTDDHLMHLIGKSQDSRENLYYIIKNSWDTDSNEFKGKLHMSLPYIKAKTIAIMVHENAVPKHIKEKLNL